MASFKPVSMILISIPILGESGPDHLAVESVTGFVGGVSVERVVGNQSVANCRTKIWAWSFGAACEEQQNQKREDKTFHDHTVPFIIF
jgi:hypothetical protein